MRGAAVREKLIPRDPLPGDPGPLRPLFLHSRHPKMGESCFTGFPGLIVEWKMMRAEGSLNHLQPVLESFEQACAVDSDTLRCAGRRQECRTAKIRTLGTSLSVPCNCPSTSSPVADVYNCLGWQRLLWLNPCVASCKAQIEAFPLFFFFLLLCGERNESDEMNCGGLLPIGHLSMLLAIGQGEGADIAPVPFRGNDGQRLNRPLFPPFPVNDSFWSRWTLLNSCFLSSPFVILIYLHEM
ncbi:unnamed protein product [Notodromas monacha]|uniref:Uncharacterized protein n=1 Tax=Notodromas monacha TaxID=399045 RepID=A0A7R9BNL1_9CRUS|nr:unnamed protein product [Notodromas monacha]CAG0917954.1 unnamed protein product [Notodromas monacha]